VPVHVMALPTCKSGTGLARHAPDVARFAAPLRCKYTLVMQELSATELPCACSTLRKASRSVSRLYDAALAEAGVSSAQLPILRAASIQAWLPLNALAAQLFMERTSLYRTLAPMVDAGWIKVESGRAAPRRAKSVSLTRKGRAVTQAANVHWDGVQTRIVESFGTRGWESLHKDILKLAALGAHLGA